MKYVDEYRDRKKAEKLLEDIRRISVRDISLMEVCGTHTVSIFRNGIRELLPQNISLVSGPGCPVCVTPIEDIDKIIQMSRQDDTIICLFGDMIKVPGSSSDLRRERIEGADIRLVYSTYDALKVAEENRSKRVVFHGIGFETTAPTVASAVLKAEKSGIDNFFIVSSHKLLPPALEALVNREGFHMNGFLCPGHVSTMIGTHPYEKVAKEHNIPCVIAGFEPLDIIQSIHMLVKQVEEDTVGVEIQYRRGVSPEGNTRALDILYQVFEPSDSKWRGLGLIPKSGLRLREVYRTFDAEKVFDIAVEEVNEPEGCLCSEVIVGEKTPFDCPLFGGVCDPENPVGPCMVSSEGTCGTYYRHGRRSYERNG